MLTMALIALMQAQPAAAAASSVQAMFDAATAAADRSDYRVAADGFAAIEKRLEGSHNRRSLGIARLRKGEALFGLFQLDEARAALLAGLPDLPATDPTLRSDLFGAYLDLGSIALRAFDPTEARERFSAALGQAETPVDRVTALLARAEATTFTDSAAALADTDAALVLVEADKSAGKATVAEYQRRRGEVLLNQGRAADAVKVLEKAVTSLGGLTLHVDRADIMARSDAAIALMLTRRLDDAHRYFAYAAAGQSKDEALNNLADMTPPPCGPETGLSPEDSAIVEFSILDDGTIGHARPIWASRPGMGAYRFAAAVADWSFAPTEIAKIKPFFRSTLRIEMRCSTSAERPGLAVALAPAVEQWLASKGLALVDTDAHAGDASRTQRAALAATPDPVRQLPLLLALAGNPLAKLDERAAWRQRAYEIGTAAGAPPQVLAYLAINLSDWRQSAKDRRTVLRDLLARPAVAADPRAEAALRLSLAETERDRGADARALLTAVTGDKRLDRDDPLRIGALVRLASLEAADRRIDAAREAYRQSGLSAQQCALVDASPVMLGNGASDKDFPTEALTWGFQGWAKLQFDIAASGQTVDHRIILAYPPFVFDDATLKIGRTARYTQSYRPDGGLGCGGQSVSVNYRLP